MDRLNLLPSDDDIIIHCSAIVEDIIDPNAITSKDLKDIWGQLVYSSHPEFGNPHLTINPSVFMPPDLDHFLAIRCRAVSSMEKYGCNSNGDAFEAQELIKSHRSLIGKGFYIEHSSHDPRNAIGIIAHAQWLPDLQYVVAIALVDKIKFPNQAKMIRDQLKAKTAGVSIGCVAGTAQCSECGNIAKKVYQVCDCMNRTSPFCKKGKQQPNGRIAHDICRELTFYELSYTRNPADKAALPYVVQGTAIPVDSIPDEIEIAKLVDREWEQTIKSQIHKLIKGEIDRSFADDLKELQHKIRPLVRQMVRERRTAK